MFTGLIEQTGRIEAISRAEAGLELKISTIWDDLADGESIAVNGVCLTVLRREPGWFTVAAMITTVSRTTVEDWKEGDTLNLERAMRADTRFGGHIVQGHVDGVGEVRKVKAKEDAVLINVKLPKGVGRTLVLHGSVALDGVSLTVNDLQGDKLQVALIDYTLHHTSLGRLKKGSRVNVETDVIGKYVQRLVAPYLKG
jgi:riboflavin synthase